MLSKIVYIFKKYHLNKRSEFHVSKEIKFIWGYQSILECGCTWSKVKMFLDKLHSLKLDISVI